MMTSGSLRRIAGTLALVALGSQILAAVTQAPAATAHASAAARARHAPRPLNNTGAPALFDAPLGGAPLDTPLTVTGGFCEYRIGHFHAGFDFSTGRQVGVPVYAPRAGHIARMRTSGVGYGRSLYLETDDGRLIQFGHLDAFVEPLASFAEQTQIAGGQYEQDVFPERTRFPIRRGQQIAWSGESGAGGPHLHFEIRRGDMAYHPMRAGLVAGDSSAPGIASITFEPLDDTSYVERAPAPRTVALDASVDTVLAVGRLRAIAAARDGVWDGVDRMVPWSTRMEWGSEWVEARFDSVSWLTDMVESDDVYDAGRVIGEKGLVLWAPARFRPRVLLASAPLASDAGTLVLRPGDPPLTLTLTARDAVGNTMVRRVVLRSPAATASRALAPRPAATSTRNASFDIAALPGGCLRVNVGGVGEHVRDVRLGYAGAQPSEREAVPIGGRWVATLPSPARVTGLAREIQLSASGLDAAGATWQAASAWSWVAVDPDQPAQIDAPGMRWSLAEHGVFEPTVLLWRSVSALPSFGSGATRGGGLEIEPGQFPLRRAASLTMPGALTTVDRLYRHDGSDWNWVGGERDSLHGTLTGESRTLGMFAVAADTIAPKIGPPRSHGERRGAYNRLGIEARLEESGSGVDARGCFMRIDGARVPSEWDPEAGVLRWRPRVRPARGAHAVEVVAADKAGNVRRRAANVVID